MSEKQRFEQCIIFSPQGTEIQKVWSEVMDKCAECEAISPAAAQRISVTKKGQRLSYLAPGHVGDVDGGVVGLGDPLAPDEQGCWAPHLPWPQPLLMQGVT